MQKSVIGSVCAYLMSSKAHYQYHELGTLDNISEIEANPASSYSGTEPYVHGRTDATHHTMIRPTFVGHIKTLQMFQPLTFFSVNEEMLFYPSNRMQPV